jgi:hypothetical protein
MDELVERLSSEQPVVVGGPKPTLEELQTRLDDIGIVFVQFTETSGGTDLGVRIDRAACRYEPGDFARGAGTAHVEGTLILNDDPVRCIADFDLATLKGTGRLVLVKESELVG